MNYFDTLRAMTDDPVILRAAATAEGLHNLDDVAREFGIDLGDPECHCGRAVSYGFDGDTAHHRGMCAECDATRCDAYPLECPYPRGESKP